jgi:DNA-binding transcriptional LysR family regulator
MRQWNANHAGGHAMKRYQLPPLHLLEAFEAAARHLSFTQAAAELSLTQSAVSRQIAMLEERLGVPLFQRLHRKLRLTEPGQQLLAATDSVLQQLQGVSEQLRQFTRQKTVVVTTTAGFAGLWLIPRLTGFTETHPDVDVRISASLRQVHLDREGVDLAMRYGPTAAADPQSVRLFGESFTPLCSPALCERDSKPLRRPEDLRHHTLLQNDGHDGAQPPDWSLWLRVMKLDGLKPAASLHFSDYDQMVQAALRGQGVALGRLPLTQGLIDEGKLVAPFSQSLASPMAYRLLRSQASRQKPEVSEFVEWLLREAAG